MRMSNIGCSLSHAFRATLRGAEKAETAMEVPLDAYVFEAAARALL
jgi:hypothetical protein